MSNYAPRIPEYGGKGNGSLAGKDEGRLGGLEGGASISFVLPSHFELSLFIYIRRGWW